MPKRGGDDRPTPAQSVKRRSFLRAQWLNGTPYQVTASMFDWVNEADVRRAYAEFVAECVRNESFGDAISREIASIELQRSDFRARLDALRLNVPTPDYDTPIKPQERSAHERALRNLIELEEKYSKLGERIVRLRALQKPSASEEQTQRAPAEVKIVKGPKVKGDRPERDGDE